MPPRSDDVSSNADLAAAAAAGDHAAFAQIVVEYQDRIVRHAYRLLGDWELAQDVAQDTFVAAYEAMGARRPGASLAAWLFRIATNKALDRLRRRRLIRWLGLESARRAGGGDPAPDVAQRSAVERALASLKREDALCLLLHVREGLSHGEIAEVLGISPGAVQKRVSRAKEAFRRAYRREEDL